MSNRKSCFLFVHEEIVKKDDNTLTSEKDRKEQPMFIIANHYTNSDANVIELQDVYPETYSSKEDAIRAAKDFLNKDKRKSKRNDITEAVLQDADVYFDHCTEISTVIGQKAEMGAYLYHNYYVVIEIIDEPIRFNPVPNKPCPFCKLKLEKDGNDLTWVHPISECILNGHKIVGASQILQWNSWKM